MAASRHGLRRALCVARGGSQWCVAGASPGGTVGTDEEGFTLVEMLVVLLVIGIVLAIAIPTFLGIRTSNQDTLSQTSIDTSMTVARQQYQFYSNYSHVFPQDLAQLLPSIHFVPFNVASSGPNHVSVDIVGCPDTTVPPSTTPSCRSDPAQYNANGNNDTQLVLASYSSTGVCWFELSMATPVGSPFGLVTAGTYYAAVPNINRLGGCSSGNAPVSANQWKASWTDVAGTLSAGQ